MFCGKRLATVFMAFALILFGRQIGMAGEHPEHPTADKAEHPEKAAGDMKSAEVTKEELAKAISAYVSRDAELKGGYFLVFDREANRPLALKLEKVHKERLSKVAQEVYFACADFRAQDGKKVYDLDVFMRGPDVNHLDVTEVSVHKEDGAARYGWMEKDGIWSKSPAKAKKEAEKKESKGSDHEEGKKGEHPQEHPSEHPKSK